MSLASRVEQAVPQPPGPKCGVIKALRSLDQADADALDAVIYERLDLTGAEVEELLREEGITTISYQTVNRHRRGLCATCRHRR